MSDEPVEFGRRVARGEEGEGERCDGLGRRETTGEKSPPRDRDSRCGGELDRRELFLGGGGEGVGDWRLMVTCGLDDRVGGEGERRDERGGEGVERKPLRPLRFESRRLLI